ncbi:hypothetical protein V1511DRAFT_421267 [Dipodascopsis uninucleata]
MSDNISNITDQDSLRRSGNGMGSEPLSNEDEMTLDEVSTSEGDAGGGFITEEERLRAEIEPVSSSKVLSSVFSPDYLHDDNFQRKYDSATPIFYTNQNHEIKTLSPSQQSRFVNYVDEQLLHISRKYIKRFTSSESDSDPVSTSRSAESSAVETDAVIDELDKIVDLIWYSVSTTTTPFIQSQYFLRIADDVNEYTCSNKVQSPAKIFHILAKLDRIFYRLIIGAIPSKKRMSNTERVRLEGIVERSRVDLVNSLGHIPGFETEITRVYEKVLEELN